MDKPNPAPKSNIVNAKTPRPFSEELIKLFDDLSIYCSKEFNGGIAPF